MRSRQAVVEYQESYLVLVSPVVVLALLLDIPIAAACRRALRLTKQDLSICYTGGPMQDVEGSSSSAENITKQTLVPAQEVVRQVQDELNQLLQQREEIMRRIGTAKKTIAGLAIIFGDDAFGTDLHLLTNRGSRDRKSGFTPTCRAILVEADRPLSAREIRDRMRERAPILVERQKDAISSITTIMNRLVDYGEAERVTLVDNTRGWQWVTGLNGGPQSTE